CRPIRRCVVYRHYRMKATESVWQIGNYRRGILGLAMCDGLQVLQRLFEAILKSFINANLRTISKRVIAATKGKGKKQKEGGDIIDGDRLIKQLKYGVVANSCALRWQYRQIDLWCRFWQLFQVRYCPIATTGDDSAADGFGPTQPRRQAWRSLF